MKRFHTYRDGLPPTPCIFATAKSIDRNKTPVRIGDIVHDTIAHNFGVVVGIFDDLLIYVADSHSIAADMGDIAYVEANSVTIIGHTYDVLADVARIEAAAART